MSFILLTIYFRRNTEDKNHQTRKAHRVVILPPTACSFNFLDLPLKEVVFVELI